VGRDNKILLWENCWEGRMSLRDAYPKLYANFMQKELRIEDVEQLISLG